MKRELLRSLYTEYISRFGMDNTVFGDGNEDSEILLIGEAPGKDEVRLSKPFSGAAGKKLNELLIIIQIDRRDIFITNTIKYRLSRTNPATGRLVNRPAVKSDIEANRPFIIKEILIIKPRYIVTLGNVPLKALYGSRAVIGELHGKISELYLGDFSAKLFPLYHPASVIYNRKLEETLIEDMYKLKNVLT